MFAKSSKQRVAETWASLGPGSLLLYAINYQDLMRVYTCIGFTNHRNQQGYERARKYRNILGQNLVPHQVLVVS